MKDEIINSIVSLSRRNFLGRSLGMLGAASLMPLSYGCQNRSNHSGTDSLRWAQPLAQDYTVAYSRSGKRIDGPGIAVLSDGMLMVITPTKESDGWSCEVTRSADGGKNWSQPVAKMPYHNGPLFMHDDYLYLFAIANGTRGDIVLLRTKDGGINWSEPVTLFNGKFWNSTTSIVIRDNLIYWSVDNFDGGRGPCVVVGDMISDLMNPKSWRISNHVPFPGLPESLMHPQMQEGYPSQRMLEPAILNVNDRLRVLSAVKPPLQATTNLCAVFDVTDNGKDIEIKFTQFHPMPGGQVKFCIVYDEVSRLFWATVNLAVDGQDQFNLNDPKESRDGKSYPGAIGGNDRRFLMLQYSLDGLNWFPAGCVARAGRLSQSFMYPSHVIDSDDMLIVARSSFIGSDNRHDARAATFHRVHNFRKLAMNLKQDID